MKIDLSLGNAEFENEPILRECYWCEKPTSFSKSKVSVCPNRFRLLVGAGISDKEIYKEEPPEQINNFE